ncbi:cupredoxin family protein [Oxalobacteraceae bacterium R-40]|uniref:Cupredoxin family protein n=1 Tax=Keguizhuia sedimenti TaxID=3064264 RepID=A0ABU1BT55_9BURK|nr:cupredoxin family protein [Oxalobacteraceae bacterium R-40]
MPDGSPPSQANATQRQGTDLGAPPRVIHPAKAGVGAMDHSAKGAMEGMDHSTMHSGSQSPDTHAQDDKMNRGQHGDHGAHGGHASTASGKPGNAANAARTINIKAYDTMRFEPAAIKVKAGETIRFVVTNVGKLPHELMIGTAAEQKQHEQMMQQMPGMKHEDGNGVSVDPGQTKTLVWQFGSAQDIELACHIPGHYPAGMVSKVNMANAGK